ncbi:hypothetical protein EUGRSUZ_F00220 [Eucalyptus grandis]|uniref:Uncharacterized protein n=2 Tax=Eucalyptus grandis TaxID=71139 RepID=A0ACC3KA62_EUCGR|nr:hypothetical protein EUGRSUZ_F00220 [Eucalyptus grandis]
MEDDDKHCYLELNHTRAGFLGLARLLFHADVSERKYIGCHENYKKELREFGHRWIIFISIVGQKVLHLFKGTLEWLGKKLEFCLNLPSTNGGFLKLVTNALKGNVVRPARDSPTFASAVGNLDPRVDLDSHLKHGDARYNAYLSMMAAKLSYENNPFVETTIQDRWKQASTRAIMFKDRDLDLIVVAFRGTRPFDADAWCTDIDISWFEVELELEGEAAPERVSIHGGFMKALGLQRDRGGLKEMDEVAEEGKSYAYHGIKKKLKNELGGGTRFILTGHSLGGALAILFVGALCMQKEDAILRKLEGVYTFGQPRVGDERFGEYMESEIRRRKVKYYRYVYSSDIVPRLPCDARSLGSSTLLLDEEPNKNCSSWLWYIPNILIAIWELIRGFIMPCMHDPTYRESWFLVMFRMLGIVFPGVSAHSPQDYVNLTQLAPERSTEKARFNRSEV